MGTTDVAPWLAGRCNSVYIRSLPRKRAKMLRRERTCFQHICTHTRSHAPSIPQQTFCCFLCLSLLVVISLCFLLYVLFQVKSFKSKNNMYTVKKNSWNAVLQLPLVRARVSTCQGPLRENEHCQVQHWKKKRRRNERDKKKETNDERGKWRKMHRLIKKIIELFYTGTF